MYKELLFILSSMEDVGLYYSILYFGRFFPFITSLVTIIPYGQYCARFSNEKMHVSFKKSVLIFTLFLCLTQFLHFKNDLLLKLIKK